MSRDATDRVLHIIDAWVARCGAVARTVHIGRKIYDKHHNGWYHLNVGEHLIRACS